MISWRDDIALARARLARLEAAEEAALTGKRVEQIGSSGDTMKYAQTASLADLQRQIAETRLVIARLSGHRIGGAIIPTMGG